MRDNIVNSMRRVIKVAVVFKRKAARCTECLDIMYSVLKEVTAVRQDLGLECEEYSVKYLTDVRKINAF